jgi:predicted negative regulator of RcsB-dependent stress response
MAEESVFEKRHVEPSAKGNVEGLLEHFNLPPAVIRYVRRNKRAIQVVSAAILIIVVSIATYDSYREKRMEKASSALSQALQKAGEEKEKALQAVIAEYSGTVSSRWANVELAHIEMEKARFKEAAAKYAAIRDDLDKEDPLFALTVFGYAQALEAGHEYDAASAAFEQLKGIEGYQAIAVTGLARIQETQGNIDKAVEILNAGLASLSGKPQDESAKRIIEQKIARLKVRQ